MLCEWEKPDAKRSTIVYWLEKRMRNYWVCGEPSKEEMVAMIRHIEMVINARD